MFAIIALLALAGCKPTIEACTQPHACEFYTCTSGNACAIQAPKLPPL